MKKAEEAERVEPSPLLRGCGRAPTWQGKGTRCAPVSRDQFQIGRVRDGGFLQFVVEILNRMDDLGEDARGLELRDHTRPRGVGQADHQHVDRAGGLPISGSAGNPATGQEGLDRLVRRELHPGGAARIGRRRLPIEAGRRVDGLLACQKVDRASSCRVSGGRLNDNRSGGSHWLSDELLRASARRARVALGDEGVSLFALDEREEREVGVVCCHADDDDCDHAGADERSRWDLTSGDPSTYDRVVHTARA